jgi:ribosomal protein S12 methylthiotransferase accessory factor
VNTDRETKRYRRGTHRAADPEETFDRIQPHLSAASITRCADVTGLDCLGIPVYCAIRPAGRTVQVTNGKGVRPIDARVSALMEAIEVHYAEQLPAHVRRSSLKALGDHDGSVPVEPAALPGFRHERHFTPEFVTDWIPGQRLPAGEDVWLPASAVHLAWPALFTFSTNGLASGNTLAEATLHGLYEVLERDAVSRLSVGGRLQIAERCQVIDLASVDDAVAGDLIHRVARSGVDLILLRVPSRIEVHTYWAVLVDQGPFATSSTVNLGYGTHRSPSVAASRAITEAAQSRLTMIHGAREDVDRRAYDSGRAQARMAAYFHALRANTPWGEAEDHSCPTLDQDLAAVTAGLMAAGHDEILRAVLACEPFDIAVVKVLVPGLQFNDRLF